MDKELCEIAFNKMNECYWKLPAKVTAHSGLKLVYYVPEYFLKYLHGYFHMNNYILPDLTPDNMLKFRGLEILTGYENKIIIACKDTPLKPEYKAEVQL